jgi:hypothetical protein
MIQGRLCLAIRTRMNAASVGRKVHRALGGIVKRCNNGHMPWNLGEAPAYDLRDGLHQGTLKGTPVSRCEWRFSDRS